MSSSPLVIAVANRKGGAGKTTTAVNLAAEWGRRGLPTLVIDLDTQGHVAIGLGCGRPDQRQQTVHNLFRAAGTPLRPQIIGTGVDNLWLAPADTDFAEQITDPLRLRQALAAPEIRERFQRVVIDTPPTLDPLLTNALAAAHGVVVPFVPHYLAEIGVRQLAKLFYQVATRHNPELRLLGLLPIMYDRRIGLHQQVLAELGQQFGEHRLLRGVRNNIKLAEAFAAGLPVCAYAPRSSGCMDYHMMSQELESSFQLTS